MGLNVEKLTEELLDAGIPIEGCSSDGRIDFVEKVSDEQRELAKKILANHDPRPTMKQAACRTSLPPGLMSALALKMSSRWEKASDELKAWADETIEEAGACVLEMLQ